MVYFTIGKTQMHFLLILLKSLNTAEAANKSDSKCTDSSTIDKKCRDTETDLSEELYQGGLYWPEYNEMNGYETREEEVTETADEVEERKLEAKVNVEDLVEPLEEFSQQSHLNFYEKYSEFPHSQKTFETWQNSELWHGNPTHVTMWKFDVKTRFTKQLNIMNVMIPDDILQVMKEVEESTPLFRNWQARFNVYVGGVSVVWWDKKNIDLVKFCYHFFLVQNRYDVMFLNLLQEKEGDEFFYAELQCKRKQYSVLNFKNSERSCPFAFFDRQKLTIQDLNDISGADDFAIDVGCNFYVKEIYKTRDLSDFKLFLNRVLRLTDKDNFGFTSLQIKESENGEAKNTTNYKVRKILFTDDFFIDDFKFESDEICVMLTLYKKK